LSKINLKLRNIIEELKRRSLIKLSPSNIRDLPYKPGIYVLYLCEDVNKPLYVGSSTNLYRRLAQLRDTIRFEHIFTWNIFWKEVERIEGRNFKEEDLDVFWIKEKSKREEIIVKIENLLDKICFKYIEFEGLPEKELRELERKVIDKLKPINPHYRNKKRMTLDNLLRGKIEIGKT